MPALPFRPCAVLADLVKKHLQPQGLDAEHWPQPRVHQLLLSSDLTHMLQATHGSSTQGSLCAIGSDAAAARLCFQPENPNPANSNSAACYVCQASVHAGCPNLRERGEISSTGSIQAPRFVSSQDLVDK